MRLPDSKIIPIERVSFFRNQMRLSVVMTTNGCFDLLHRGHLASFELARSLGVKLWVGVNSDRSFVRNKGRFPINPEADRAYALASLEIVDYVTVFDETTPERFLLAANPEFHLKGGDYREKSMSELTTLKDIGCRVFYSEYLKGYSTTSLIEKIKKS